MVRFKYKRKEIYIITQVLRYLSRYIFKETKQREKKMKNLQTELQFEIVTRLMEIDPRKCDTWNELCLAHNLMRSTLFHALTKQFQNRTTPEKLRQEIAEAKKARSLNIERKILEPKESPKFAV